MGFPCHSDGTCPFLYECESTANTCQHLPVFPLTLYPLLIYCLFPFCSAICNMSGNSFGQYKVILLMDLLNYQANEATILTYPLITGTALFNAISLIFRRHAQKPTSLIDYNIVMVLLPNNLFGSAVGGLVNKFIPPIASDSICFVLMVAFAFKFFMRYRGYKKQQQEQKKQINVIEDEKSQKIEVSEKEKRDRSYRTEQVESIEEKGIEFTDIGQIKRINKEASHRESLLESKETDQKQQIIINQQIIILQQAKIQDEQNAQQLKKLLQYESGVHLQHIFATIIIFLIFQTLSFLAQGKIIQFSICSEYYAIGMSLLAGLFLVFDVFMYKYTAEKMRWFRKIGYNYQCKLDLKKNYLLVCLGGFIGGFNGGVFGIGASTTMIFTLLYLKTAPSVISATVGFEVFFIGLGSLCQALATNQINIATAGFFILETFILGGILTFFARKFLNRFSQLKINQCLMLIVFSLVSCSALALIVSIALGYLQFDPSQMDDLAFEC